MNTHRTLALGAVTTGALGLIAMAAPQGGGLITFQSGQTALAAEVNANFQANEALALTALNEANRLDLIEVSPGGAIGIGTAIPGYPLNLIATAAGFVQSDTTEGIDVGSYAGGSAGWYGTYTNHPLHLFVNNGAAALTVTTNENVGIGTDTPDIDFALDVEDVGLGNDWIGGVAAGSSADNKVVLGDLFGVATLGGHNGDLSAWTDLAINPGGSNNTRRVGIGNQSPSEKLDVSGNVRCVSLIQTSDARLKTDVEDLSDALETVGALRGVSYEWDLDQVPYAEGGRQVGFLAQEVREVLPEAVREDDEGQLAVAYTQVVPVLVEAVQELEGIVHSKDAEIDELRAEVERLRSVTERVEALESTLGEVLATR